MPNACCLCDGQGYAGLDLCEKCHNGLPHNPTCCLQCAIPLSRQNVICGRCLTQPSHIDSAIIPYQYRPPIDYMIKKLKFAAETKYSRLAGELLANAAQQQLNPELAPDILIPVPIHHQRLLERGFNQAEMIARTTAKRLGIKIDCSVVLRSTHKLPQSSLSARAREDNIRRAFKVTDKHVEGLHVAIVDDVYTTGATARAIARQLHKAGAKKTSIWAIARTP